MFGMRYTVALSEESVEISNVEQTGKDDSVLFYPPGVMLAIYVDMSARSTEYIGDPSFDEAKEVYVDFTIEGNKYSADITIPPKSYVHDTVLMMVAQEIGDHLLQFWINKLNEEQEQETVGSLDRPTGWGGNREDIEA